MASRTWPPAALSVVGAAVWSGSWYLMHLEITRWQHVRPDLRFNHVEVDGHTLRPGLPLRALYVACAVSPVLTLASAWRAVTVRSPGAHLAALDRRERAA